MTASVARGVRAWLARRVALLLLLVTAAGLVAGGAAWLAGVGEAADLLWLGVAACGVAYACWVAAAAIARGRLSVDVIALLALAGTIAVGELLAAAVISVMLASGRALEDWAASRARHDLSALLARAPRTARRYRDGSLETVPLDEVVAGDLLLVAAASSPWTAPWPSPQCWTNPAAHDVRRRGVPCRSTTTRRQIGGGRP